MVFFNVLLGEFILVSCVEVDILLSVRCSSSVQVSMTNWLTEEQKKKKPQS